MRGIVAIIEWLSESGVRLSVTDAGVLAVQARASGTPVREVLDAFGPRLTAHFAAIRRLF